MRSLVCLGLLAAFYCSSAQGASVAFTGTFLSNPSGDGMGALGSLPSPISFDPRYFSFGDGSGSQALTGGGSLPLSSGGPLFVTAGNATLTDAGTNDVAQFVLNVSTLGAGGPANGLLTFNFTGDLFSGGSTVSQANFEDLWFNSTSVTYTDFSTGTLNVYSGVITAVPEPTSALALVGLGTTLLLRRRRS